MDTTSRSYAVDAASKVSNSPFDELTGAVDNLGNISVRLQGLTDRICGQAPPMETNQKADIRPVSDGLIADMSNNSRNIRDICQSLANNLQRIEDRL